jgi:hypothetical protein
LSKSRRRLARDLIAAIRGDSLTGFDRLLGEVRRKDEHSHERTDLSAMTCGLPEFARTSLTTTPMDRRSSA